MKPQGKLLTLGVDAADDGLQGLNLKLWAVEGLRADATPPCSLTLKLFPSGKPPEGGLAAVAVVAGDYPHCWVAVGLTTGAVHVLRVDTSESHFALRCSVTLPWEQRRAATPLADPTALPVLASGHWVCCASRSADSSWRTAFYFIQLLGVLGLFGTL